MWDLVIVAKEVLERDMGVVVEKCVEVLAPPNARRDYCGAGAGLRGNVDYVEILIIERRDMAGVVINDLDKRRCQHSMN